jgi:hypothetical protein
MKASLTSRFQADAAARSPRQELLDYISSPLEDVQDPVQWWGVSFSVFLLT